MFSRRLCHTLLLLCLIIPLSLACTRGRAASITVSPSSVIVGTRGNTIAITGTGTNWISGTPGTPIFTVSGGTRPSITAQSISDATHASITLTSGSSVGTLTITDPGTGAMGAITVNAAPPLATMTASPATIPPQTAGNIVTLTGSNTNFTSSTVFTLGTRTGSVITAQSVVDATHASVTIKTNIYTGAVTVSDPNSPANAIINVSNASSFSLTASPNALTSGSTGAVVTLTGTGTAWTSGTPGAPAFTLSGGTGASITSQSVTDATHASITVSAGSTSGTLTVTDPTTGATAQISVSSVIAGTLTGSPVLSGVNLTWTAASAGTAPYLYQVHRGTYPNFITSTSTRLTSISGLSHSDTTAASHAVYWYKIVCFDSASNTSTSNEVVLGKTDHTDLPLGFIGDSIMTVVPTDGTESIPTAIGRLLSKARGLRNVMVDNEAVSGSSTRNWVTTNTNSLLPAAVKNFNSQSVTCVYVMLGDNDAPSGFTASSYQSNMNNIVTYLVNAGLKVILLYPTALPSESAAINALLVQYQGVVDGLADNVNVFTGGKSNFQYLWMHTNELADGTHPNAVGVESLASLWIHDLLDLIP